SERRLRGYLTSERIIEHLDAAKDRARQDQIEASLMTEPSTVMVDTPLSDVINLASEGTVPIAVTDDTGRLRGVVVRGAILAALARTTNGGPANGKAANGSSVTGVPGPSPSGVSKAEGSSGDPLASAPTSLDESAPVLKEKRDV